MNYEQLLVQVYNLKETSEVEKKSAVEAFLGLHTIQD